MDAADKISSAIPTAPRAMPLLGHIPALVHNPWRFLISLPQYGEMVQVRIGPKRVVVVCDLDLTRRMLRDDRTFDKGGPTFDGSREVAGDGLVLCSHSRHRQQRRLVQGAFHPDRIRGYAQTMTGQVTRVIDSWRDGQVLDVYAEMKKATSRATTSTLFSNSLPEPILQQAVYDLTVLFEGFYRRTLMPRLLTRAPTPSNRRFERALARLRHTIAEVVADRRTFDGDRGDLLSALVTGRAPVAADGDRSEMSDAEIIDQVITFFLAGTETTAALLAWALYFGAANPDIEQRLHAEVDIVLAGRSPAHVDLNQLKLTGQIVTETLRICPPAWLATRVTTSVTRLGKYTLPVGTSVAYSPYLLHHRGDLFTEPERFDPDRFDPAHHLVPRDERLLPFGDGPRTCIGDRFAMTEATLALATIAARVRLELVRGQPVRPALGIVLRPAHLRMRMRLRTRPDSPRADKH
ncbi:cytochrome P450 [Nocardia sp. NPDC052566]|uniref:cytochrome P450 n=1 Tax=Nocardia sp. NPDC052566 TaxID=3364330 RepID=UPI0037CA68D2